MDGSLASEIDVCGLAVHVYTYLCISAVGDEQTYKGPYVVLRYDVQDLRAVRQQTLDHLKHIYDAEGQGLLEHTGK